ncbi:unnamed protein product [Musa textilis]
MEYERIRKVQIGLLSPTKLRMKLLGPRNSARKGGSNSAKTSPSKNEDMKFARNSLLAGDMTRKVSEDYLLQHSSLTLDEGGGNCHHGGNDTASSFEFHRVERIIQQPSLGLFSRHVPSKWNDAEKWIINRQIASPSVKKKTPAQNQGSHQTSSLRRVETDSTIAEHKASVVRALDSMRNEFNQTAPQDSVSMRDIGTEMTPVPTPLGSITPTRSSISSLPSTPRQGVASPLPTEAMKNAEQDSETKGGKDKLTEREMRLKIRREIAALGMQLGKMNIASWASKEEVEQCSPSPKALDADPTEKEYEACAAAWEEAENTKHMARYKREEVKIQAWECYQKAKIEAKTNSIEAKAERVRARAIEKMAEKLAMARRQADEKQAAAEARMNKQASRTAHRADQIRRTGQIPSPYYLLCCGGFS